TELQPLSSRENLLALLEIDAGMPLTAELVRRQYNHLMERYALEKFEAAGPEFVALAQSKRESLLAALTALLNTLGEKVETPVPADTAPQELRHNPDLDAVLGG